MAAGISRLGAYQRHVGAAVRGGARGGSHGPYGPYGGPYNRLGRHRYWDAARSTRCCTPTGKGLHHLRVSSLRPGDLPAGAGRLARGHLYACRRWSIRRRPPDAPPQTSCSVSRSRSPTRSRPYLGAACSSAAPKNGRPRRLHHYRPRRKRRRWPPISSTGRLSAGPTTQTIRQGSARL